MDTIHSLYTVWYYSQGKRIAQEIFNAMSEGRTSYQLSKYRIFKQISCTTDNVTSQPLTHNL